MCSLFNLQLWVRCAPSGTNYDKKIVAMPNDSGDHPPMFTASVTTCTYTTCSQTSYTYTGITYVLYSDNSKLLGYQPYAVS